MQKKLEYIDTAKGILITLVIIGHILIYTTHTGTIFFKIIYAFHMPAFFMISGILFDVEKWKKQSLKKFVMVKAKHIIIPYFFFEIIGMFFHQMIYIGERPSLAKSLCGIFTLRCNVGADWYLPTYFIAIVLYFIYAKYGNKYIGIASSIIVLAIVVSVGGDATNHFIIVVVRCLIGYALIFIGHELKGVFTKDGNIAFQIISLVILCLSAIINHRVELYYCIISNPILFLAGAVSGTYFLLNVAKFMHNRAVIYIGQNTLPILGTHQNIIDLLNWFFGQVSTIKFFGFVILVIILGELIIVLIMNKICPALIGKISTKEKVENQ